MNNPNMTFQYFKNLIAQTAMQANSSPTLKERFLAHPKRVFAELGLPIDFDGELVVHCDDDQYMHFIMPPNANIDINEEMMNKVYAAKINTQGSASSLSTWSTASTLLDVCYLCLGTLACASTAGSNAP